MAEWFIARDDKKVGPVSTSKLKELAQSGKIKPTDRIWREGLPGWVQASEAAGLFDSTPKPVKPAPVSAAPQAQPKLSPEEIVQRLATKYTSAKVLDQVNPKRLASAIDNYAGAIQEDEIVLSLGDDSFRRNGSAGILVTNKRVFSSHLEQPVEFADITHVSTKERKIGANEDMVKGPLKINSQVVYSPNDLNVFWIELIEELAKAAENSKFTESMRDVKENANAQDDDSPWNEWWGKLIGCPVMIGFGLFMFYQFDKIETSGGRTKVNVIFLAIYKVTGKWGVLIFSFLLAVLFLAWGIYQLSTKEKEA